jgi:flagellar motor switch protein FliN/FliY
VAEDEELNLEDLNKAPATDSDVAVQDDAAEGMALEGIDADDDTEIARTASDLEAVFDIPVHVTAVLGKSRMRVSQLLKLGRGAVIELDRKVGEAIDIYVNNRLVARGEVVVVEDRLGVTMTEIIKADRR